MVLRLSALQAIVLFLLKIMADGAQDAFTRVQRFSTDWHPNSSAGSTVRKITHGMWALDLLNDTILLALARPLFVLIVSMKLLRRTGSRSEWCRARRARLCRDDGVVLDAPHRAGRAHFKRLGHQGSAVLWRTR
ncbi:hypothetical protein ACVWZR_002009 [Bradyrhizobium sp. i1.3.1]